MLLELREFIIDTDTNEIITYKKIKEIMHDMLIVKSDLVYKVIDEYPDFYINDKIKTLRRFCRYIIVKYNINKNAYFSIELSEIDKNHFYLWLRRSILYYNKFIYNP